MIGGWLAVGGGSSCGPLSLRRDCGIMPLESVYQVKQGGTKRGLATRMEC